jgi:hypothetical protein
MKVVVIRAFQIAGFEGTNCDKEIDECKVNKGVCKNGGKCLDAIG